MIARRLILFFILLSLIPGMAQPAAAHGYIVRAIPEDRAVLERAPSRVQYWFSEALEPEFSALNVRDQSGEIIAAGGVSPDDSSLMLAQLPPDLPDGAYVVELRPAFASDGHVLAESRVFFVGEEVGGIAGIGPSDQAMPLEVAWRSVSVAAVMLLFGLCTLYAGVMVPAWGNQKYRAGLLPPRVMRRMNIIMGGALFIAIGANLIGLIQQTMTFFNIGFVQALEPNFWSLVRVGSRFGDIWNVRMLFLGVVGLMFLASLYLRDEQPELVRAFWTANAWMLALIIGSYSVLSHAAGSLMWPWVAITVDWLHALGAGLWVGGLVALVLVLPTALEPYEGEQRRLALLAALRRFSRIAAAVVFIVVASGVYSALNWVYTPSDVTNTNFGLSLIVKVALAAGLVGVGALHHIALRPDRYARFRQITGRIHGFTSTLRLEAALALAVLFAASLLSATPVPVPDFIADDSGAPTGVHMVDDLTVVMSILPGGPGVNTYDVTITRGGQRVPDLNVEMSKVHPARDQRSSWQIVDAADRGLYVTAGDEINREGRWWTVMNITEPDGRAHRLVFEWDISEETGVLQSVDPGFANIGALVLLIGAVVWVGMPSMRRIIQHLELSPANVTVGVAAALATLVFLAGGYFAIQESRQRYDENLNPPPEVVNAVLPTQASIQRGQRIYEEHCIGWQTAPRDFNALRDRMTRVRDEELFRITQEGWRDMPPCGGDLSFFQRWDVVNFARTLGR